MPMEPSGPVLEVEFTDDMPDMGLSTNGRAQRFHMGFNNPKISVRQILGRLNADIQEDKARWGWAFKTHPKWLEITSWFLEMGPPYRIAYTAHYRLKLNKDPDGIVSAMKTALDAMVEVRLISDDKGSIVQSVMGEVLFGAAMDRLVLRVEQIDGSRRKV